MQALQVQRYGGIRCLETNACRANLSVRHSCSMLAALPAQPASGLQGLLRAVSRSKPPATELTPEQQDNPDTSPATVAVTVQGAFPSNYHSDSLSNLPAAAASATRADATTAAVPLASILCRHFTLGKLRSDFPSRVEAYSDRLEYYFKHPSHGKTHMVMYFRDFGTVQVRRFSLVFKINTTLDMFTAHYSPADPQHMLSIIFDSPTDLQQIHHAVQQGVDAHKAD